ncbi:hypothetical protein R3P38DRAFT_3467865 [Favolaschia claudopus]|uniref:Uncharacterized protein n=1 Tax=Favolaschia claudopus TaxID=2862362 RepID=A0AAW0CIS6_9AGAR
MSLSRQTQNPTTVSEDKLSDDLCPDCQVQRLTLPTICTGFHTAANKNKLPLDFRVPAFVAALAKKPGIVTNAAFKASAKTVAIAQSPPADSAATPLSLPPVAGPYARMIAPAYAMKILTQDFSYPRVSQTEMNALRKDSEARIWVKYWNHNDQGPLVFHPRVTSFPFFEPAKCDDMTQKLGAPCSYYDMLDLSQGPLEDIPTDEEVWISTSEPIRVTPNSTIYLRAPDVHSCSKLRSTASLGSQRKRSDSSTENQEGSSPSKKTKLHIDLTQSDTEEDLGDAATPPITPSPSPSPSKNMFVLFCFSFLSSKMLKLFAPSSSLIPSIVSPSKKSLFPLAFACDMVAGFRSLSQLPGSLNAEQQFQSVFGFLGVTFRSSTYSDSYNAWLYGDADMISKAVACGNKPGGEWSPIVTYYRKHSQELKTKYFANFNSS